MTTVLRSVQSFHCITLVLNGALCWLQCCDWWLQCKVCMQTFICTTSEVKCKEHAEARHPKSDLFTCFPHLKPEAWSGKHVDTLYHIIWIMSFFYIKKFYVFVLVTRERHKGIIGMFFPEVWETVDFLLSKCNCLMDISVNIVSKIMVLNKELDYIRAYIDNLTPQST